MKLKGKATLITGAASGIGKEIALLFAREGARTAIDDLNGDGANAVAADIRANGGQAIGVHRDVCDESDVNAGTALVVSAFGGIDILVSNAGLQIVHPNLQQSERGRDMSV